MWFRRRKSDGLIEAEHALEEAQNKLKEVKRRGPAVKRVAEELRQVQRRNHFGEQLEAIMMRRGQAR
jgi:hypothetical protein